MNKHIDTKKSYKLKVKDYPWYMFDFAYELVKVFVGLRKKHVDEKFYTLQLCRHLINLFIVVFGIILVYYIFIPKSLVGDKMEMVSLLENNSKVTFPIVFVLSSLPTTIKAIIYKDKKYTLATTIYILITGLTLVGVYFNYSLLYDSIYG